LRLSLSQWEKMQCSENSINVLEMLSSYTIIRFTIQTCLEYDRVGWVWTSGQWRYNFTKKWRYNRAKKVAPVKNLSLDPWVPIPRYSCPQNMERSTHLNIFFGHWNPSRLVDVVIVTGVMKWSSHPPWIVCKYGKRYIYQGHVRFFVSCLQRGYCQVSKSSKSARFHQK